MYKIYGEREKNGIIKSDIIDINTIQFRDCLGNPYRVKNYKDLIKEMKTNYEPISCLFSEFDKNTNTLSSGETHLKLYYNKAKNEDILVITDKKGNYKVRNQSPLFVIILDISGSMSSYNKYLQNNLIPKLLRKLNYFWTNQKFFDLPCKKGIGKFELRQAISSKIKLERFLERYDLKDKIKPYDLKYFCDDIIPLITFSDDGNPYFYDISDFEECSLSRGVTSFTKAAIYLGLILKYVSRERSIRLLSFSDGEIYDSKKAMKFLDFFLNSDKTKHQMNSVSVRVCHQTEPDTQILMKLSAFSHSICDMTQIVINPYRDNVDEVVDKLYKLFLYDGMEYNLKL